MSSLEKSTLVLERTEDPELIRFTHERNSAKWKGKLSVDEYVERERLLGQENVCKYGGNTSLVQRFPASDGWLGIKYFVLRDTALPNESKFSQIVSSCETLNRPGFCYGASGTIEDMLVICIGGVFTPEQYRGRRYASTMIHKLNEFYDRVREKYAAANSKFWINSVTTLYSEVGTYYEPMGYHSMHVPIHCITEFDKMLEIYCHNSTTKSETRVLKYNAYEDLVHCQRLKFEKSLKQLKDANPDSFVFSVVPDISLYNWFAMRDAFTGAKLHQRSIEHDKICYGVALEDNSHILWFHDWSESHLVILKVHIEQEREGENDEKLKKLIRGAIEEAIHSNFHELEFWDEEIPSASFPEFFKCVEKLEHESKINQTNSSLSAVKPPMHIKIDDVIWANNTKFCWF